MFEKVCCNLIGNKVTWNDKFFAKIHSSQCMQSEAHITLILISATYVLRSIVPEEYICGWIMFERLESVWGSGSIPPPSPELLG